MDIVSIGERAIAVGDGPPPRNCDFCSGNIYIDKASGQIYTFRNLVWVSSVKEDDFSFDDGLFQESSDLLYEDECYLQSVFRQAELVSKNFHIGAKDFFFELYLGQVNTSEFQVNLGFYSGNNLVKVTVRPQEQTAILEYGQEKVTFQSKSLNHMAFSRLDGKYFLILNNQVCYEFSIQNIDTHIGYVSLLLNNGFLGLKKAAFGKGV